MILCLIEHLKTLNYKKFNRVLTLFCYSPPHGLEKIGRASCSSPSSPSMVGGGGGRGGRNRAAISWQLYGKNGVGPKGASLKIVRSSADRSAGIRKCSARTAKGRCPGLHYPLPEPFGGRLGAGIVASEYRKSNLIYI